MKKLAPLTLLALAAATSTAFAQVADFDDPTRPEALNFASTFLTVPTSANANGQNGAVFATHLSIMNPTTRAFEVQATFYDAAGTKRTANISLAAGELKVYENFLASVLSATGAGAITFSSPDSVGGQKNNRFIVSTEVWTQGAGGRFGTTVPVLEFTGTDAPKYAAGIQVDSGNRTNVGCFNQSSAPNQVKVDIFNGTGGKLSTITLDLAANAWGQTGVPDQVSGGYAVFTPAAESVCWATAVNNTANDGRFIYAVEYTP